VPRCAANQEAETETATLSRRGNGLLIIADIGCVCGTVKGYAIKITTVFVTNDRQFKDSALS